MTLHELGIKHGTDKVDHNYLKVYDELFSPIRDKAITLLEIGIYKGASIKMWREYFPNGYIIGIDKAENSYDFVDEKTFIIKADVCNYNFLLGQYDIIIDDGSHIPEEQIAAYQKLFPLVKPGGYYIIEDIYTQHFGKNFYEYQKRFIDFAYQFGGSVTYHNTLTIIRTYCEEYETR